MPLSAITAKLSKKNRRHVLALGGFAHFVHDGFTDSVYVLLPLWAAAFSLNHAQVGSLKMIMSGTLAAMQVPAGIIAERYGERAVLATGTLITGLGFMLLGLAGGFMSLAAFLVVAGAGCGTQHPLASSVVSRAYSASGRRAALGVYNFTGDLGKVVAPAAVGAAAATLGWAHSAAAYGAVGILAGVVLFALLPRRQPAGTSSAPAPGSDSGSGSGIGSKARPHTAHGWGITNRRGYSALAAIGMVDSAVRVGSLTFIPFLLVEKGASADILGFALSLVFAGGATGKLVCGFIAERVGILRTVLLTEAATAGLIAAAILLPLRPTLALLPLFGLALNGTSSVLYGTIGDFVEGERQARAYGLFYTLGIGSGALAPVPAGAVSDAYGVSVALGVLATSVLLILPLAGWLNACLPKGSA